MDKNVPIVVPDGIDNSKSISSYSDKELSDLKKEVFWETNQFEKTASLEISLYDLCKFLKRKGFGEYKTNELRTADKQLVRWDNKVLKLYDIDNIKQFIIDYFNQSNRELYNKGNPYAVSYFDEFGDFTWSKKQLMNRLMRNNIFSKVSIPTLWKYDIDNPKLFMDEQDKVFIRFKDKIVQIDKDNIVQKDYSILGDESVWETQLIDKPFDKIEYSGEGLVEQYFKKTCYDMNGNNSDDWTENFTLNEERWRSLKTTYGYMISQYKNPEEAKCVIFIDKDTTEGDSNGRTGKSIVLNSMAYWKPFKDVDGKIPNNLVGHHSFDRVDLDCKFVHIEDLYKSFDFETLYNKVAGRFSVNPKNKPSYSIPFQHSPKLGISTNYISTENDASTRDRQHFVEFGGYWRTCKKMGEKPSDKRHLGKLLFEHDFTDKDWNEFYNFGFKCVQEFLKYGLIEADLGDLKNKMLRREIEGEEYTGEYDWIVNWIENDRVKDGADKLPGISTDDLYTKFRKDFTLHIMSNGGDSFYKKKFIQSVYKVAEGTGYEYNGHKRHLGDTPTDRKHLKSNANGSPTYMVIITENPRFKKASISGDKTTQYGEKTSEMSGKSKDLEYSGEKWEDLFNG